jgi:hypothetical protein
MSGGVGVPGRLENLAGVLSAALAQWAMRDDTKSEGQAVIRDAADTAMKTIDAMLRDLHTARVVLAAEIRRSDDAAMARTEALLDKLHRDGAA